MSAGTAALCSILLFVFVAESADQKIIAESGQDVTLTCRAPNNIDNVKWSRADLGDKHVLLYKDGRFVLENQHESFEKRVDLQDRQMKDGEVSLILKNVTINDTGTYKCGVMRQREGLSLITSVYLHVDPPGQTGWHSKKVRQVNLSSGLSLFLQFLLLFLFFVGDAENSILLINRVHNIFRLKIINHDHP
ncbi:selection and upkeep of intraepithelial T-cells protein 1 [Oreochromis niloticus]|uniref:selection and upkeep of intraepithelial T-cells protein 1 n=1 Tax=Oreochromis niloticus TaxID=8128 RepID=UPI00090508D7|nr:selection and upkeep of intraepithelial T-cells protein 1 [Oreochromis niloticus]